MCNGNDIRVYCILRSCHDEMLNCAFQQYIKEDFNLKRPTVS